MFSVATLSFGFLLLSPAFAQDEQVLDEFSLGSTWRFADPTVEENSVEVHEWQKLADTFAGTPLALATSWNNQMLLLTRDGSIYRTRAQLGFERVFDFSQLSFNDDEDISSSSE